MEILPQRTQRTELKPNIQHPTSNEGAKQFSHKDRRERKKVLGFRFQVSGFKIQHPTSNIQRPTFNIQRRSGAMGKNVWARRRLAPPPPQNKAEG
jgi:hypothetical protein